MRVVFFLLIHSAWNSHEERIRGEITRRQHSSTIAIESANSSKLLAQLLILANAPHPGRGSHPVIAETSKQVRASQFLSDSLRMAALSPYPFQLDAIDRFLTPGRRGVLLADEMGLGKTVSVISALNQDTEIKSILIVVPKSVISVWAYELKRWLQRPLSIGAVTAKSGMPENQTDIVLLNYEMVTKHRKDLDQRAPWDVIVCDEAHYLKNPDAKRTYNLLGDTTSWPTGDLYSPFYGALPTKRIWFVSGSPMLNNAMELYPILKSLDPEGDTIPSLKTRDQFGERYCRKSEKYGGWYGARNTSELRKFLTRKINGLPPLMIRRTKAQVLQDLPAKRHAMLPIRDEDAAAAEERELKKMLGQPVLEDFSQHKVLVLKDLCRKRGLHVTGKKVELIARLEEDSRHRSSPTQVQEPNVAESLASEQNDFVSDNLVGLLRTKGNWSVEIGDKQNSMGVLARARHNTALRKVDYAIELLESIHPDHKVIVFAHHRDVQKMICDAFEDIAVTINGDTPPDQRGKVVERFQHDQNTRIFVGSIRAASEGITLTAASHVLFVEFDWSPMIMQQAEDRCHRIGQANSVLIQYLYIEDTIDEALANSLATKLTGISASLDGTLPAASQPSYLFDFGKHIDESIVDVLASDPFYIDWIVKEGLYEDRPSLKEALISIGKIRQTALIDISKPVGPTISELETDDFFDDDFFDRSLETEPIGVSASLDSALRASAEPAYMTADFFDNDFFDNSLETESTGDSASIDSELRASSQPTYIFDFGRHHGESIVDMLASEPDYIDWIVDKGVYEDKPALRDALISLGKITEVSAESADTLTSYTPAEKEALAYVFDFGKHSGNTLGNVINQSPSYVRFLVDKSVYSDRPNLREALRALGKVSKEKFLSS